MKSAFNSRVNLTVLGIAHRDTDRLDSIKEKGLSLFTTGNRGTKIKILSASLVRGESLRAFPIGARPTFWLQRW